MNVSLVYDRDGILIAVCDAQAAEAWTARCPMETHVEEWPVLVIDEDFA